MRNATLITSLVLSLTACGPDLAPGPNTDDQAGDGDGDELEGDGDGELADIPTEGDGDGDEMPPADMPSDETGDTTEGACCLCGVVGLPYGYCEIMDDATSCEELGASWNAVSTEWHPECVPSDTDSCPGACGL